MVHYLQDTANTDHVAEHAVSYIRTSRNLNGLSMNWGGVEGTELVKSNRKHTLKDQRLVAPPVDFVLRGSGTTTIVSLGQRKR